METLPPVHLGAMIFAVWLVLYLLRPWLLRRVVLAAAPESRTRRQFWLDWALSLVAGFAGGVLNRLLFGFPAGSTVSLIMGCVVAGFFIAMDMALARERTVIGEALAGGGMTQVPRRLFSMTGKFSLVASLTSLFVSLILILVISRDFAWLAGIDRTSASIAVARQSVLLEVVFIMVVLLAMVLNLIISYSRNLRLLFDNQTGVLERVSLGDLTRLVPVVTRDEFGFIAGHTNSMIHGLRHRTEMMGDLKLAEEVQQSLLPRQSPRIAGMEIAGTSIYCRETGGDYYDYLQLPHDRIGVVVADAADHGIGSALYMTTARALLISQAGENYHGPAELMDAVNRLLLRDSQETGRFMTAFFLEVEPLSGSLRWVRAGHNPALLYEPQGDRFRELGGRGSALGVQADPLLVEEAFRPWRDGSVILVGTDGIHETRNPDGEFFGVQRMRELLRENHDKSASAILETICAALANFRGAVLQEDDVTLVILKRIPVVSMV